MNDQEADSDLRDDSDHLLGLLSEIQGLERRKREHEISSDEFHRLADRVEDTSREVFRTAADERMDGDRVGKEQDVSIDDVQP